MSGIQTGSESCSFSFPETSATCTKPSSFSFPETCSETCTKPSSFSFPKTCSETCTKPSSFSLPKTCSETCTKPSSFSFPESCPKTCLKTSSDTCLISYPETCSKPSSFTCPETCSKPSSFTCPETCSKPSSFTSPETCSKPSSFTCPETCSKPSSFTCPETCSKPSSFTCPETCSKPCSLSSPKSSLCSISTTSKFIIGPRRCGSVTPKAYSISGTGNKTRISTCSYRANNCSPCPPLRIDGGHCGRFGARIMAGGCYGKDYDYFQKSEKATMQDLNDRLASYLDKVHYLEAANATLEKQIREYYENKGLICQRDYSCYFKTIECLQEKMKDATVTNGKILLQIDNSKLAADDFKIKYQNEAAIRQCVKADIDNLRCILNKTCQAKTDLEAQNCTLQEDLVYLKKTHQEVVAALLCQLTDSKVCVEVDAAPQQDLKKVLDEIRCHYETIIDQHCREQECWFQEKMADLCKDAATKTECLETSRSQISDLRRTLQCLEIELQSQISMKGALECSLSETEARYSNMLAGYQTHINTYEAELCQVRTGIEQQGRDYAELLDVKSRLEQEIATYRCLLEKQDMK
ncbi:keratin, type I cytoskeletal 19-like [Garra rufa]|uniref:keratin, type I cytoskeletal 19-like n=1 Tax=Garra rufa TaxID=137080 RepID=UPI003CCECF2D